MALGQSLALNQTQLSTAAKWYVGVYGTSATGCDFTISALAQASTPLPARTCACAHAFSPRTHACVVVCT